MVIDTAFGKQSLTEVRHGGGDPREEPEPEAKLHEHELRHATVPEHARHQGGPPNPVLRELLRRPAERADVCVRLSQWLRGTGVGAVTVGRSRQRRSRGRDHDVQPLHDGGIVHREISFAHREVRDPRPEQAEGQHHR